MLAPHFLIQDTQNYVLTLIILKLFNLPLILCLFRTHLRCSSNNFFFFFFFFYEKAKEKIQNNKKKNHHSILFFCCKKKSHMKSQFNLKVKHKCML